MSPRHRTASTRAAASARTALRASRFPWMSLSTAYRTRMPSSGRRAELPVDAIQHPVDEAAGLAGTELLRDLDRLVDRHLRRDVVLERQLEDGDAQDVSIDHRHALEIPVLGRARDQLVDLRLLRLRALHERGSVVAGRGVDLALLRPEIGFVRRRVDGTVQVQLIEELQRELAGATTTLHRRRRDVRARGGAPRSPATKSAISSA